MHITHIKLPAVRRAFQDMAWAILPSKLEAMVEVIEAHATRGGFSADEIKERLAIARGERSVRAGATAPGTVAVLPLVGVIAPRMDLMMEMSGGTSSQRFATELDAAIADPNVSAVVIDCDSPGGSVQGTPELAKRIHAARGSKPIIAVANGTMASAAYWICSAADEVVATPSADVGSIGVFCVHLDASEHFAKTGLKHTIIKAGAHKAEGNPYEPLSDDALAFQQAQVDEYYGMFVGAIAKHRGVKASDVEANYGQGRCLTAKQALAAGMVDRIATLEETIKRAGGRSGGAGARRADADTLPIAALDIAGGTATALVNVPTTLTVHYEGDPNAVTAAMVAGLFHLPSAAGAVETGSPLSPEPQRPHQAKEKTVTDPTVAPDGAVNAEQLLAAERKRASEIRALGRDHKIDPDKVEALVESGVSVDVASKEILASLKAARAAQPHITVGQDRATQKPWETLGHFAAAVMDAGTPGGSLDPRFMAAAQGMNQAVPSEGGFLIPPQFAAAIWDAASAVEGDVLSMTDNYTIEGESLTIPANGETSRANGSRFGGVRGYWINEADQITKSSPKIRAVKLEPQELAVLIYATEKSLRNSPAALQQFLTRAGGEEISFMTNASLFGGTGAGQPMGYVSAPCAIEVAKETSQAAATIKAENIAKMWARLHPRARANAAWFINADCEPQLDVLSTVVKNVAGTENVGGFADKLFDAERRTLKGRPVIVSEFCETLGTSGDIVLAAWNWYATGTRGSGLRADTSLHVRFEYAEQAFRFMFEIDGKPMLASAITPFKGSSTQSSIVKLATRS